MARFLAVLNAGGGDQVAYDATTNRYFLAASRFTGSGLAGVGGACTAAVPCAPQLIVVDGGTRQIVTGVATGNNAHSVAVDRVAIRSTCCIHRRGLPRAA